MRRFISYLYRYHPLLKKVFNSSSGVAELSPNEVGKLGEKIACVYLKSVGFKILYQNYRGPKGGELDIVARDRDSLVFIEVKTRRSRGWGRPLDAVNKEKQELIERGAYSWLQLLGRRDMVWRFDVVEIILEPNRTADITLVREAF